MANNCSKSDVKGTRKLQHIERSLDPLSREELEGLQKILYFFTCPLDFFFSKTPSYVMKNKAFNFPKV